MGSSHARAYDAMPGFEIVGLVSRGAASRQRLNAELGGRYPQWNEKFRGRIKQFLKRTPFFFAANGSHPLMGRSLIYRWAVLSPLVMGYREGLWPHSPGLLRAIVRRQLEYHWGLGCFDEQRGQWIVGSLHKRRGLSTDSAGGAMPYSRSFSRALSVNQSLLHAGASTESTRTVSKPA